MDAIMPSPRPTPPSACCLTRCTRRHYCPVPPPPSTRSPGAPLPPLRTTLLQHPEPTLLAQTSRPTRRAVHALASVGLLAIQLATANAHSAALLAHSCNHYPASSVPHHGHCLSSYVPLRIAMTRCSSTACAPPFRNITRHGRTRTSLTSSRAPCQDVCSSLSRGDEQPSSCRNITYHGRDSDLIDQPRAPCVMSASASLSLHGELQCSLNDLSPGHLRLYHHVSRPGLGTDQSPHTRPRCLLSPPQTLCAAASRPTRRAPHALASVCLLAKRLANANAHSVAWLAPSCNHYLASSVPHHDHCLSSLEPLMIAMARCSSTACAAPPPPTPPSSPRRTSSAKITNS